MIPSETKHPIRTCVGCRKTADKADLLRVVVVATPSGDEVVLDARQRHAGRGAYVHRVQACVENAASRGGLARSFRRRLTAKSVESFRELASIEAKSGIERGQS